MPSLDAALPLFALACLLAASSGAIFRAGPWYEDLHKPPWRPPGWLFGPVWLVLYSMIAVSGWLVWTSAPAGETWFPMTVYAVHLVFNALWSYCFFGLRRPGLALADMTALWLSILATMTVFYPVSALAAGLLVPYLLWVSFAWVLNRAIWRLNRDRRELRPSG
ncbi:MAG TPA: tryptophan-rich sensory protein [Kiloniellaceae bacterium]|nr:tryptophan-rich sensory protein [Kiloniellaceae bacterium]